MAVDHRNGNVMVAQDLLNGDEIYTLHDKVGSEGMAQDDGGSGTEYCHAVEVTPDSGFVMVGSTRSFGSGNDDVYVVRTDSYGDTVWTWTYGGVQNDWANDVKITPEGDYIIVGGTESSGAGNADALVIKLQSDYVPDAPVGYVDLISPGPPDWAYRLNWISGALDHVVFTNFCDGTVGSVGGDAASVGWMASNYADSIVFATTTPLTSGSIDTFWLSHPWCSDQVNWQAGDSLGSVDGPLPVELTTFQAFAADGQVTLSWTTATEENNDYFSVLRDDVEIAQVDGAGNSQTAINYEYIDHAVVNGVTYTYRLISHDINGTMHEYDLTTQATPGRHSLPTEYALYQNHPNPFNPTTQIAFDLKESGFVNLKVFNLLGQEIATLISTQKQAGTHSTTFNANNLPSGIYLYRLEVNDFISHKKMLLMK